MAGGMVGLKEAKRMEMQTIRQVTWRKAAIIKLFYLWHDCFCVSEAARHRRMQECTGRCMQRWEILVPPFVHLIYNHFGGNVPGTQTEWCIESWNLELHICFHGVWALLVLQSTLIYLDVVYLCQRTNYLLCGAQQNASKLVVRNTSRLLFAVQSMEDRSHLHLYQIVCKFSPAAAE